MAAVTTAKGQLYVVELKMSSPNFTDKTEINESENSKKLYYHFQKEQRNQIGVVRQQVNMAVGTCAKFYTMRITNDIGKGQLEKVVQDAHLSMQAIDPTLKADIHFIPLSMSGLQTENLMEEMLSQIQTQIHEKVLKKISETIEKNGDKMTSRTRGALLKMLDRLKTVNVTEDVQIDHRIEEMRNMIMADQILPLQKEIMEILDEEKDRFSTVDVVMENEIDYLDGGAKAADESEVPELHPDGRPEKGKPVKTSSKIADRIDVADMF
jgi:rRNA-processing protein FCF1